MFTRIYYDFISLILLVLCVFITFVNINLCFYLQRYILDDTVIYYQEFTFVLLFLYFVSYFFLEDACLHRLFPVRPEFGLLPLPFSGDNMVLSVRYKWPLFTAFLSPLSLENFSIPPLAGHWRQQHLIRIKFWPHHKTPGKP